MCIRDSRRIVQHRLREPRGLAAGRWPHHRREDAGDRGRVCLLYTSDAADERSSVDLGGRRIIKKKKKRTIDASNTDAL